MTVNVSGGGGVENEGCNIEIQGYFPVDGFIAYTAFSIGPSGDVHIIPYIDYIPGDTPFDATTPFTILKNSSFFIGGITEVYKVEGSIVAGSSSKDGYYSFWVTGDCKIAF